MIPPPSKNASSLPPHGKEKGLEVRCSGQADALKVAHHDGHLRSLRSLSDEGEVTEEGVG